VQRHAKRTAMLPFYSAIPTLFPPSQNAKEYIFKITHFQKISTKKNTLSFGNPVFQKNFEKRQKFPFANIGIKERKL